MPEDAQRVSSFIASCYANVRPSAEAVRGWRAHPVYHPELWMWILHVPTGSPTALAIAEFDSTISELSLEWIQVHPQHRRCGLGTHMITELLSWGAEHARIATVSGLAHSEAERFYRACGFQGSNLWWVLRADPDAP